MQASHSNSDSARKILYRICQSAVTEQGLREPESSVQHTVAIIGHISNVTFYVLYLALKSA